MKKSMRKKWDFKIAGIGCQGSNQDNYWSLVLVSWQSIRTSSSMGKTFSIKDWKLNEWDPLKES